GAARLFSAASAGAGQHADDQRRHELPVPTHSAPHSRLRIYRGRQRQARAAVDFLKIAFISCQERGRRPLEDEKTWAMTTNLGDEAEAFFRMGEDGTYEGGPASIAPLAVCEEPAEVWDIDSADEWLERRRRFKRLVATVIGGLGAGLVVLSMCLLG